MAERKAKSNELHLQRVFDASVRDVWDAWTDSEQAAQWWGPRGFTITTHGKDLRPGGTWVYTMHGPDGVDYPNRTVYYEVEQCKKLVYDHGASDDRPPLFRVTALFREEAGKTHLDMTMALATPEAAQEIRKFIKKAGGDATWDRLAEYLDQRHGAPSFVINRSFAAPRDAVFEMWTRPDHLVRWLPPSGMTMEILRGELRAGAEAFFKMSGDSGFAVYGRFAYLAIQAPERLEYAQQFCDAQGNLSRHPGAPVWPETMYAAVTFAEEGPDQTRVKVRYTLDGKATSDEIAAFLAERGGMTLGWTGSFDKLEVLLETGK